MKFKLVIMACILVTTSWALAQDEPTIVGATTVSTPEVGTVTGTNVYVRSRADTSAYPCSKISRPSTVRVIAREGDWLEIEPPAGVFSIISNKYVTPSTNGTTGTVSTRNVRVRAGTDQMNLQNLENHHVIQKTLNTGDTVEIIGQGLDYYKIVPPEGVTFFISANYVSLDDDGSLPTTPGRVGSRDDEDNTDRVDIVPAGDVVTQFRQAEEALADEIVKPNVDRDLKGLLARYEAIDAPVNSTLELAVNKRIRFLNEALRIQDDQKLIEQQDLDRRQRQANLDSPTPTGPLDSSPVQRFDAQGVLRASGVFVGGSVPKRYLLRHPTTGQIIAYVESNGRVDLGDYQGKNIGVFGDSAYNSELGMSVLTVTHLVLIDDAPAATPSTEVEVIGTEPGRIETMEVVGPMPVDTPKVEEEAVEDMIETIDETEAFLDEADEEPYMLPPAGELPDSTSENIQLLPEDSVEEPVDEADEFLEESEELIEETPAEMPEERPSRLIEREAVVPEEDPDTPSRPSRPEIGVVDEDELDTSQLEEMEDEIESTVEEEAVEEESDAPRRPIREPLPVEDDVEPAEDDFDWDFDTNEFE